MKKLPIDTNFNYLGPQYPALSQIEIEKFQLKLGERIVVFQDDDEWFSQVKYDQSLPEIYRWYVELELKFS